MTDVRTREVQQYIALAAMIGALFVKFVILATFPPHDGTVAMLDARLKYFYLPGVTTFAKSHIFRE